MPAAGSTTYHELVLGELMRDFGHLDRARDLVTLGSGAWRAKIFSYSRAIDGSQRALEQVQCKEQVILYSMAVRTCKLQG